jgi:hypothetical protein
MTMPRLFFIATLVLALAGVSRQVCAQAGKVTADPCQQVTKTFTPINLTASGQLITGLAGKRTYICNINFTVTTAGTGALVEGTGTTCATNIAGMAGGATAATGWAFPATGQLIVGIGVASVAATAGKGTNVCLLLGATGQVSGVVSWVQQ